MASDKPQFQFADLKGYEGLYEGEQCDLLPFEGLGVMEIHKCAARVAKDDKRKGFFFMQGVLCDDKEFNGAKLIARVHYAGEDKNGGKMARQFGDYLLARGSMTLGIIHENAKKDEKWDADVTADRIQNPKDAEGKALPPIRVVVKIGSGEYDGQRTTVVDGFALQEAYDLVKPTGGHRKAVRDAKKSSGAGAATGGGGQTFNVGGGGNANSSGAPAGQGTSASMPTV